MPPSHPRAHPPRRRRHTPTLPRPRGHHVPPTAAGPPAPAAGRSLPGRLLALVVSLGAVAGAVTAITSLWPDPDPADRVSIRSVDVRAPLFMSDVRQIVTFAELGPEPGARRDAGDPLTGRTGSGPGQARLSVVPVLASAAASGAATRPEGGGASRREGGGLHPGVDGLPRERADQAPPLPETTPEPAPSGQPAPTLAPTGTAPGPPPAAPRRDAPTADTTASDGSRGQETGPSPESGTAPPTERPGEPDVASRLSVTNDLLDLTPEQSRELESVREHPALAGIGLPRALLPGTRSTASGDAGDSDGVSPLLDGTLDPDGNLVPADVAVERLSTKVRAVRNAVVGGKREVLVAKVAVDLEVEGLRGRPVVLYIRLLTVGGDVALPEGWLQSHPVFRIVTRSDRQSVVAESWVPLPKAEGTYEVEVRVRDAEERTWLARHVEGLDV